MLLKSVYVSQKDYLEQAGNICPWCQARGEEPNTITSLYTTDGTVYKGRIFMHVRCKVCGASWQERYDLADFTYVRNAAENGNVPFSPVERKTPLEQMHNGPAGMANLKGISDVN